MDFIRQIAQMLHDEHLQTVSTLERFEALLHANRTVPPANSAGDGELARTLRDVEVLIEADVVAHFAFEEDNLFPLLADMGDGGMGALLAEEHKAILAAATPLMALCRRTHEGSMNEDEWRDLRRLGTEFVELMVGHIQKEEMGLLPMLEDAIDEARDAELVMDYSAAR